MIVAGGTAGAGGTLAEMASATTFTNGSIGALEYYDNGTDILVTMANAATTAYTVAGDVTITLVGLGTGAGNDHVLALSAAGDLTFVS